MEADKSQPKGQRQAILPGSIHLFFLLPCGSGYQRPACWGFLSSHRRTLLGTELLVLELQDFYLHCFPAGIHQVLLEGPKT